MTEPHLKRVLGMPSIVLFGLAYMVPLTVFTTYGVVHEAGVGTERPLGVGVGRAGERVRPHHPPIAVGGEEHRRQRHHVRRRQVPAFAMGRDGALPNRVFGRLHGRFRTPVLATVVVGVLSGIALVISLELASAMISFGALVAFSLVNLSVIKHYVVDQRRRSPADLLKYAVIPGIGVLLTLWLWTSLSGTTFVVGLSWIAAGFVYLLGLTRMFTRRPPELRLSESELAEAEPETAPS